MPVHPPSGFEASIHSTHAAEQPVFAEYLPKTSLTQVESYIIEDQFSTARDEGGFRVYFRRDQTLVPIAGLEIFACFICVDNDVKNRRACKVYGVGGGCSPPKAWFLDHFFGPKTDLVNVASRTVELTIHRGMMKLGAKLGDGNLLVQDLEWIDDSAHVALFKWNYSSRADLEALGVIPHPDPSPSFTAPVEVANIFLRKINNVLLSLLTPEQKIEFVNILIEETTDYKKEFLGMKNKLVYQMEVDRRQSRKEVGGAEKDSECSSKSGPELGKLMGALQWAKNHGGKEEKSEVVCKEEEKSASGGEGLRTRSYASALGGGTAGSSGKRVKTDSPGNTASASDPGMGSSESAKGVEKEIAHE